MQADAVLHDALIDRQVLELAHRARRIDVGKRGHRPSTAQRFINKSLVDAARTYQCVVRLKGGDPSVFGRLDEEMEALREAGIAFEIIPGITAASAAAAELQVSLTLRGVARSVSFLTPCVCDEHDDATWQPASDLLKSGASLAIYMGGRQIPTIARRLMTAADAETPIVVVENVSGDRSEWVGTLADAADAPPELGSGPVILLIGKAMQGHLDRHREATKQLARAGVARQVA